MSMTFLETIDKIGVKRLSSIKHFCNDFEIDLRQQFVNGYIIGHSVMKDNFVKYMIKNGEFLLMYEIDYYSDKSPIEIAFIINRDVEIVEKYLLQEYPKFFNGNVFNCSVKMPFRYISSFKVDCALGGNYEYLKLNELITSEDLKDNKHNSIRPCWSNLVDVVLSISCYLNSILKRIENLKYNSK
jgi:hypothetical protein